LIAIFFTAIFELATLKQSENFLKIQLHKGGKEEAIRAVLLYLPETNTIRRPVSSKKFRGLPELFRRTKTKALYRQIQFPVARYKKAMY